MDTRATMLSSPLGPTPTISQSMATARVSLKGKGTAWGHLCRVQVELTRFTRWFEQGKACQHMWGDVSSLCTCTAVIRSLCCHPSPWNVTHPSKAFSFTSTCSTDWHCSVSSPRFLLAIFAASGPIAASISFGSTSSNQMSALGRTDLITFNSLEAIWCLLYEKYVYFLNQELSPVKIKSVTVTSAGFLLCLKSRGNVCLISSRI